MCRVFPTVTSCNLPNVGAGGGEQVDGHGENTWKKIILIYIYVIFFAFRIVLISGPQWPLRSHPEHHQWEDIPDLMVVVSSDIF